MLIDVDSSIPNYTFSINHTDCMKFMRNMDEGSVNLIVTDPPYTIESVKGSGTFGKRDFFSGLESLSQGISDKELDEFMRILKTPNMYLWGNWKQILIYLDYFKDKNVNTTLLSWHKSNPVPLCSNKYLSDTEYCLYVRGKGVPLYGGYDTHSTYWVTPLNQSDKTKYGHPTIKPLEIIKKLILNSSSEGDVVFDPYLGSGTTAIAAQELNRSFIGCEIEEKYIEIINKRLSEEHSKLNKWF